MFREGSQRWTDGHFGDHRVRLERIVPLQNQVAFQMSRVYVSVQHRTSAFRIPSGSGADAPDGCGSSTWSEEERLTLDFLGGNLGGTQFGLDMVGW